MDTLHAVLKHGSMDSDWTAFPRAVFVNRLAAVRKAIEAAGDDAWIVYGDCQNYGELAYLTHFLPRLRSSLALIAPDKDPIILTCVGSRDIPAMQILTWVTDIRPYWRLPENLPQFVTENGLANGRVGLVGVRESMPVGEWDAIRAALPGVHWSFRDEGFTAVRQPDDVTAAAIRHAGTVVNEGLRAAATVFNDRSTVRAAAAEIERVVRRLAAEDVRILVGGGPEHGGHLRPPDDAPIISGEPLPLFLACEVQRCWFEGATTLTIGSQSETDRQLIGAAQSALDAMIATIGPNVRASDVYIAGMQRLDGPQSASATDYGLGHGIGLDANEAPEIAETEAATFAQCSGVALHVVLHDAGASAIAGTTLVRTGDTFAR